ncbi:AAA domain-containing protein [Catenulispora rubra]|uniref:AAA domain-containing protein n=1 Tax=Catenulispora rubra TaxID=280293 RepID=UPI0018924E06
MDESRNGFFTVDSFQGNQAEIIAVSLVRNNTRLSGDGLGFLVESPRMNVLLSHAERPTTRRRTAAAGSISYAPRSRYTTG